MPRKQKRISSQQAAKLLGTTSENLRGLVKAGLLSDIVVDSGKKRTRYYLESEIKERKKACMEYTTVAERTQTVLDRARDLNREAAEEEERARKRLKDAKSWMATQKRLSEMLCTILQSYDGQLSAREKDILTGIVCLESVDSLAERYGVSAFHISQIMTGAIKRIARCKCVLERDEALRKEMKAVRTENDDLRRQNDYLSKFRNPEIPDGKVFVLTEKGYAIRKFLLSSVDSMDMAFWNRGVIRTLQENGVETVKDLVLLDKEQLEDMGLSPDIFEGELQGKGVRFGMNLAKFGLGSDEQIRKENDKFKDSCESDPEKLATREKLLEKVVDAGLSVRAFNCLRAADIETFADLCQYPRAELAKFRNFGRKSLNEIDWLVERKGLSFGMDVTAYGIIPAEKRRR